MQINTGFNTQKNPMQELFNQKKEISQIQKAQQIAPKDATPTSQQAQDKERQTYGLLVLELMSDPEYQAFKRATAGMSESEKIIAAQSLYSLTSFYSGKLQHKNQGYQNFMGSHQQDFITKYKHALTSQAALDLNT